ncbi:hypothetical protein [Paraburkholderia bannensis]|uniref:hypothetical protein n=1 Tax=Paraburkholderia bannensis TaxID=765414 RepID=UPI002ABE685E|nr:hypothetical protein [Paraburkholderia bannensis]
MSLNPKPVYSADYDAKNYENGLPKIHVKDLDNAMSDTDADFSFTDDGRLKGINVAQTGQASTVVKDLVSVGVSLGAEAFTADKEWCKQADAAKSPVTITYTTGAIAFKDLVFEKDSKIRLTVDSGSRALFNRVTSTATFPKEKMFPTLTAHAAQDIQTVSEDDGASGMPVLLPRACTR